jgi:CheY-like chemotaxis protein
MVISIMMELFAKGDIQKIIKMNVAPVFIIDDDKEELEMATEIWKKLKFTHPLEVFSNPQNLIDRLREDVNPFIIICDVNLHKMDGFTLREKLAEEAVLSYKSIPFVFWSTTASNEQIKKAYDTGGHGFFLKGESYMKIQESLEIIMTYWTASKAPVPPLSLANTEEKAR